MTTELDLSRVRIAGMGVLVRVHKPKTRSAGGIHLPDRAQRERPMARVVSVGNGCRSDMLPAEMSHYGATADGLQPGQDVIVREYALDNAVATEWGDDLRIVQLTDIVAVTLPEDME